MGPADRQRRNSGARLPAFAFLFLLLVAVLAFWGRLPAMVLVTYLAASSAAFAAYALDKSAASKNRWRIRESTLHLLALLGGWPGALLAQRALRHKTRKQPFQTVYWATVLLNCALLIPLFYRLYR